MVAARVAQVFYYQLESDGYGGSTSARYTATGSADVQVRGPYDLRQRRAGRLTAFDRPVRAYIRRRHRPVGRPGLLRPRSRRGRGPA